MAGLNPTLEELRGLIRATHLFARNYKATAPSITGNRNAIECAFLRLEEGLIEVMRKSLKDLHTGSALQRERLIREEIEKLVRPDWREAYAVGRAAGL
jgi:hypothetical protein